MYLADHTNSVLTLKTQHMYLICTQNFLLPPRRLPATLHGENVSLGLNRTSHCCKRNTTKNVSVSGSLMLPMDPCLLSCRTEALLLKAGEAAAPPVAPGSNVLSAPQAKKTIKRKSHPNIVSRTDLQAVLSGLNRKSYVRTVHLLREDLAT